ncbi:MAG TPA: hypothetical protein VEZ11_02110 [Thermoanaerobaculia bacterium]|nr:hypothetical protein [Thermoanaerobaculia bacterium]
MSRRTTRRRKRDADRKGPSLFFFIALAAGLVLLAWGFFAIVRKPVQQPRPATTRSALTPFARVHACAPATRTGGVPA